jgi:hypothetical protein
MRPTRFSALGLTVLGTALLIACDSATGPGPDAITVSGIVVDQNLRPQAGAGVLIPGHPPVVTDAQGAFTVSGVDNPYDLATGLLSERGALVYSGLTRTDPLVVVPAGPFSRLPHQGSLSGSIRRGAGYTEPEHHQTSVFFESAETSGRAPASHIYSIGPRWRGPTTTTGTLHALRWGFDPAIGLPAEYAYGARSSLALSDGDAERVLRCHVVTPCGWGPRARTRTTLQGGVSD